MSFVASAYRIAAWTATVAATMTFADTPPSTVVPRKECPVHSMQFTEQELKGLARAEIERQGVRLVDEKFEILLTKKDCDWWAMVHLLPRRAGGNIGVLIDGESGKVKWSAKIDA
jgi:hypothetical protein